jgi:hypothetical protein
MITIFENHKLTKRKTINQVYKYIFRYMETDVKPKTQLDVSTTRNDDVENNATTTTTTTTSSNFTEMDTTSTPPPQPILDSKPTNDLNIKSNQRRILAYVLILDLRYDHRIVYILIPRVSSLT